MADARLKLDPNGKNIVGAIDNVTGDIVPLYADHVTGRLLADMSGGLGLGDYDYVAYTNTNATTDTYIFKSGGSSGTTVATIVIVYTDSTKDQISTVTKT